MCIRDRYQRRVRDRLLQLMAEQPLGVPFRWTYGSSPFFSTAASGLPQKHGMSQWYAREAWPAAAMERYEMGAPWDRTTQGPPAGGWHRGSHWGTFRGADGNFNDPRLAEFRAWGGMYNQVDAPGGGTNPVEHVIREKKNDEREVAENLYEAISHEKTDEARAIMDMGLSAALIDAPTSQPGGAMLTKAMILAAKKGFFDVIQLYIANGGNPDLHGLNQGYTLMHEAILAGQPAVVEVLCRNMARTDLCNTHGMNSRDIAEACVAGRMGSSRTVELERYEKLSLIHISEPTRLLSISYAVFCLKKKKKTDSFHI
eukprot:TRINITY_DN16220_c0_g1_i6.p1 TRINITY_DN16220_c0_g1~~TRINITY_DN16220_c0_g1_i6.p1  ORF type:complete len:314 (+),score=94.41 TRINITY_DN16220_c0_g1_i6:120-1061(+)